MIVTSVISVIAVDCKVFIGTAVVLVSLSSFRRFFLLMMRNAAIIAHNKHKAAATDAAIAMIILSLLLDAERVSMFSLSPEGSKILPVVLLPPVVPSEKVVGEEAVLSDSPVLSRASVVTPVVLPSDLPVVEGSAVVAYRTNNLGFRGDCTTSTFES